MHVQYEIRASSLWAKGGEIKLVFFGWMRVAHDRLNARMP